MQNKYDCIVVGAGPAGMMAAGIAGSRNRNVLLLEKNASPGKKLALSGGKRCNLTNSVNEISEFLKSFSKTGSFLKNAFEVFFYDDLVKFFAKNGLDVVVEDNKRVFPSSGKAKDVVDIMTKFLKDNNVDLLKNKEVINLIIENKKVKGVVIKGGVKFFAEKVVLATGGVTYPETGSTGFGLKVAHNLKHSVIKPKPALMGLIIKGGLCKKLQGVSLYNVECSVTVDNRVVFKEKGDMLFTHFGVSGPVVLNLSADIYDLLTKHKEDGKKIYFSVNFKPEADVQTLNYKLIREFSKSQNKSLRNALKMFVPKSLVEELAEYGGFDVDKHIHQVTKNDRAKILNALTNFKLQIKATQKLKNAMVTRGGVSVKEIKPQTMESKLIKGLYFAGELIDVDAKTGGYNMQAAFSTGYVCGKAI